MSKVCMFSVIYIEIHKQDDITYLSKNDMTKSVERSQIKTAL